MKKRKIHHACTILRTCEITHGTMSMAPGGGYKKGKTEIVTEACGSPLFDDVRQASGVCRSCAEGWEVEGNKFANEAEKAKALAAPKTTAQ